jgi:FMN-dependent NADH-azoreductase
VFCEAYQETHPGDEVAHWDLWDHTLPDFAIGARAKMTVFSGGTPRGPEAEAWAAARNVFQRFDTADRVLFSVPMWNGGIPYVLKQFIDVISQPGWIFDVDPATGYTHLLSGRDKRVAVVYSSAVWGPDLGPEFGTDFQSTYFTDWLRWTGLTEISEIRYHPTLLGDRECARQAADAAARDLAKTF